MSEVSGQTEERASAGELYK